MEFRGIRRAVSLGEEEEERCEELCSKRNKYKFHDLILILLIANDNLNKPSLSRLSKLARLFSSTRDARKYK